MRKERLFKILKLGIIFASVYTCFFGFIIDSNTTYAIAKEDRIDRVIAKEVLVEQPIVDEIEEETFDEVQTAPQSVSTVYSEPVISGNSIRVASIYNHLMSDDGSSFYLNHDLNGNYDGRGVPFVDFRNDFTGRKSIVYAHSSLAGNGPFNALQNYHNNPGYFYNNRYITVQYNGNTYTYEIFSVYVSLAEDEYSDGLEYYYRMNYSDEEWGQVLQEYKNHSEYDTGVTVNSSDKIIILQTCSMDSNYYEKYYRYNLLIMGKLI